MKLLVIVAMGGLVAPGVGLAQPAPPRDADTPAVSAKTTQKSSAKSIEDDKKLVCRMEIPTGSIRRQRVCKAPEKLEQERLEAQRYMESKMQNAGSLFGPGGLNAGRF